MWKRFVAVKNIIRHDGVLILRYISEVECLLSIGIEGNVFLSNVRQADKDKLQLFQIEQSHRLIWNQISSIHLLTDSKIIAGF